MRLLLVSGARPNYMKVAPVVWELQRLNRQVDPSIAWVLVHTGQHHDRSLFKTFYRELEIPTPHYNLRVGSGSHARQTAKIMQRFEPVLLAERPDLVVVVGDVNSTLACALTAVKLGTPVAHVEAGLRSFDRTMPEEINRLLTDAIADYLFTTERSANDNLLREGVPQNRIHFVGNVMIDTLLRKRTLLTASSVLSHLGLEPRSYAALTLHRPSNVDDRETFGGILAALATLSRHLPIVFPCHPRTRKQIEAFGLQHQFANSATLRLVDPMGYLDFLRLMSDAQLVLTDSGGIQEETTVLGVPCLTLRETTERPVTVTHGTNVVVGTDPDRIVAAGLAVLDRPPVNGRIPELWDGRAARRIVDVLQRGMPPSACPGPPNASRPSEAVPTNAMRAALP